MSYPKVSPANPTREEAMDAGAMLKAPPAMMG
jgi:hypothetical protein